MCHEIAFPAPSGSTYVSQSQGCLRKRFSGDARPLARRGRVCAGNLLGGAKLTLSYKPPSDIFQLPPLHARRFMSVKFSEARRRAFLKALQETGNQTLAAKQAKVWGSWVQLHRSTDPEFKRQVEEAVAEAKARRSTAESPWPPSGRGHLDGAELVVKGTAGTGRRRVRIARARLRQITPRVRSGFFAPWRRPEMLTRHICKESSGERRVGTERVRQGRPWWGP